jgi:AmpE protein
MEWPVVRLMAISFALTGNFMGCIQRWQDSLFCLKTPSDRVLGNAISGALSIDVDCQLGCDDIANELLALKSLLFRTSLFWLCLLAGCILVLL